MRPVESRFLELEHLKDEEQILATRFETERYNQYVDSTISNIQDMGCAIASKLETFTAEGYRWVVFNGEPYVAWLIFDRELSSDLEGDDIYLLSNRQFAVWDKTNKVVVDIKELGTKKHPVVKEFRLTWLAGRGTRLDDFKYNLLKITKDTFHIPIKKEWYSNTPLSNDEGFLIKLFNQIKHKFTQRKRPRL